MARVLVIDDDTTIRDLLREILQDEGHEVYEAGDGEAGVQLFKLHRPELVVLDMFMPNREGLETLQEIRAEDPRSRVLAISGASGQSGFDPLGVAEMLGATRSLSKPFGARRFLEAVRELLAS